MTVRTMSSQLSVDILKQIVRTLGIAMPEVPAHRKLRRVCYHPRLDRGLHQRRILRAALRGTDGRQQSLPKPRVSVGQPLKRFADRVGVLLLLAVEVGRIRDRGGRLEDLRVEVLDDHLDLAVILINWQ